MKTTNQIQMRVAGILGLIFSFSAVEVRAADFSSGSDGSYGPIEITADTTLPLPPDGIFKCTTITVARVATLRFEHNALNTPVYLLATGTVLINGLIDVSGTVGGRSTPGKGGPGGFDGGQGGDSFVPRGGDGQGPGGGNVGGWMGAAHGTPAGNNTNRYGSPLLEPLLGGSGGAGGAYYNTGPVGFGGGGGGGAILIASDQSITVAGVIQATGGSAAVDCPTCGDNSGAGSGGAIRLVAPVIGGTGFLQAFGSHGTFQVNYESSDGRIRIDSIEQFSFNSLHFQAVSKTHGSRMIVFPENPPHLDVIAAAGQTIPEGTASPVQISLPGDAPTNQTVTIQARNFTGKVPIAVVVIPANAASTTFTAEIDMTGGNPASAVVPVVLTPGMLNRIQVWTR
jgi:hypothetical protein